jgi:RNA polymerase sigma-70 factor (ECF subfamily)
MRIVQDVFISAYRNKCISRLDIEYRDIIILRDINGFSYDEIGNMLKIPEGTVKSRLSRSRKDLKNCLKRLLGDL